LKPPGQHVPVHFVVFDQQNFRMLFSELLDTCRKILLVEDNEMNRDMLSRRLQRKGYTVVTAEDGEKGLSLARSEAPDLILMDISLPVMGGWEVTRLLKADESTRHIRIIALTAHAW